MAWPETESISPSRMGTYLQCPLKFRFESIQKVRGPSGPAAVAGTTMHLALERLMGLPAAERTREALDGLVEGALVDVQERDDYQELSERDLEGFADKCRRVTPGAFDLVDIQGMNVESTEQRLEVDLDGFTLRGDIDLLEYREGFGRIVWDWKSGKAPLKRYEAGALLGLEFYAVMVQIEFGQIPAGVGLIYIAYGKTIKRVPTHATVEAMKDKILKVRDEIQVAARNDSFATKTGPLCDWCPHQRYCPAFGGDPDDAPGDIRSTSVVSS